MVCIIFIVHTMPWRWVYLKMGLPDAYGDSSVASSPKCAKHFKTQAP